MDTRGLKVTDGACWTGEAKYDYPSIEDLLHGKDLVVDLGCGSGRYLELLAGRYELAVGVDINEDCLSLCKSCDGFPGFPGNVEVLRADVLDLPLQSASVSAVLAWGLLCQLGFDGIERSLREMARILKQGGSLVLGICPSQEKILNAENIPLVLSRCGVDCDIIFWSFPNFLTIRGVKRGSDSNGAESHAKGRSPDSLAVADRPVGRRSRSGTSHMD